MYVYIYIYTYIYIHVYIYIYIYIYTLGAPAGRRQGPGAARALRGKPAGDFFKK